MNMIGTKRKKTKPRFFDAQPAPPAIKCRYLGEPKLCFGGGGEHVDPKIGIARFGPKSFKPNKQHPSTVRVGFIGSADTIDAAHTWIEQTSAGVAGDEKHPEFPGYRSDRGFFSNVSFDDHWRAQLTASEIDEILTARPARTRFELLLELLESKLSLLASKDQTPEYVVISLPDSLYRRCRVVDYRDRELGDVHRDLRRAFKAMAMKYRIPTQILRQSTIDGRDKDHPSKIAWNFFAGLYFKAGGFAWGPVGLQSGTCYIGVGFYRSLGSNASSMQTSLVQAFDEHGNGLVLRGHDFTWDAKKEGTRSPHLKEEQAFELVQLVLNRYQEEMGQTPQRVVVHKTSRYWPEERSGFKLGLKDRIGKYDLVALSRQSTIRLLTASQYPPLRGTYFSVEDIDYLYTTGFVAELGQFHGMHVPAPIQLADHVGQDTARETLLKEILILTKMNSNSSRLGGLFPITLRFSQLVGDIMREIPPDREPLTNFKFYM